MRSRRLHPLARLIASLSFGIAVLAFFAFVSAEMATHYFQGVAERTIRRSLADGSGSGDGAGHDLVCRRSGGGRGVDSECDPEVILAEHSFRSASCNERSVLRLFGKPWNCVVRFTNGESLDVRVSLGLGRHRLELLLPVDEPDA